ncbi:MarR family transcriptional regulator [Burkholderia ubonensis]|uniref:MarR family transcriptional regulator n=1 Tax=Burkholderia ubonensis TaxID=101571 RepID=UPI000A765831|nr:MarR family transcriptional regulator [Burkholderia ubonensis]
MVVFIPIVMNSHYGMLYSNMVEFVEGLTYRAEMPERSGITTNALWQGPIQKNQRPMTTNDPLSRFHAFITAYEGCRASALASALQVTPMAARALGLINAFPGMTLHELSCVLGGSQGQVIGAAFDLKHFGYIDITEEQNDNRRCVLRPIRDRMFGFDGYQRLVKNLASDAGIAERLDALLPLYQDVLMKALEELQGDAQSVQYQAQRRILARVA